MRSVWWGGLVWLGLAGADAHAERSAQTLDPPRHAIGGGIGFIGFLHLDYSAWLSDKMSIDIGVTPLFYLNLAAIGLTGHQPLWTGPDIEHNAVFSATVVGLHGIMDGLPGAGPGARVGYELMTEHLGISATAGAFLALGAPGPGGDLHVLPDVRLTISDVFR